MMAAGFLSYPVLAALSTLLLVAHILLQSSIATRELGRDWNAGARDEERKPKSPLAGRAARASANFRETYPAFLALIFALALTGEESWLGLCGVLLWFGARLVYIPLYLRGVPYVRSMIWLISMLGMGLMLLAVLIAGLGG
jgi:uncharacterized MAPEG superfamily protein